LWRKKWITANLPADAQWWILPRSGLLEQRDIESVVYIEVLDGVYEFKDNKLSEKFQKYHKDKANLRIVR